MAIRREQPIPLEGDEQALPLEGEDSAQQGSTRIQAFGAAVLRAEKKTEFKRPLNLTGAGATRCRLFNSKITVAALDHMVAQINEWLDGEKVEVKCVDQVIGTMEGKKPEPNVIITVWY